MPPRGKTFKNVFLSTVGPFDSSASVLNLIFNSFSSCESNLWDAFLKRSC